MPVAVKELKAASGERMRMSSWKFSGMTLAQRVEEERKEKEELQHEAMVGRSSCMVRCSHTPIIHPLIHP
jgi:predicted metal-binding protein